MISRSRGPLVLLLALLIAAPSGARAADDPTGGATCLLHTSAPKGSARLRWRASSEDEGTPGFWVSEEAMKRASVRMDACVTGWSTCEVNLATEKGKRITPGFKTWAYGVSIALAVGFAAGALIR